MTAFPCPFCGGEVAPDASLPLRCAGCERPLVVGGGRYRIQALLGRGGMGLVYEALGKKHHQRVAVKVIAPRGDVDWKGWELFERSSRVLQQLHHRGLPKVHDFERGEGGALVLVRETFDGGTLEARIRKLDARLAPEDVLTLTRSLLGVLAYLQSRVPPVVHRDIKPANIMFRTATDWIPVLVDFDSVAAAGQGEKGATVVGTPGYAAPEQFTGEATPASDVYGVGATILFVVTHRDADELPRVHGRFDVGDALSHLPEVLRSVLMRMVEPDAERRFPTAEDALRALDEAPKQAGTAATKAPTVDAAPKREAPPPLLGRIVTAVFLAGVLASAALHLAARHGASTAAAAAVTAVVDDGARLRAPCERGEASACYSLADAYGDGAHGIPRDPAQATHFFERACELGDAAGCNNAGVAYGVGKGVAVDPKRAMAFYTRGCDAKHGLACRNLAGFFERGEGTPVDSKRAFALVERACDLGEGGACNTAGWDYESGRGVAHDDKRAASYYALACDRGLLWGCRNSGIAYRDGLGVEKDLRRAAALFTRTCDGNEEDGCFRLGMLLRDGDGAPRDLDRAAALFETACDADVFGACNDLGVMYDSGNGVEKNEARADRLFDKACRGKSYVACENLGIAYADGTGVARDDDHARRLFGESCDGGIRSACARARSRSRNERAK